MQISTHHQPTTRPDHTHAAGPSHAWPRQQPRTQQVHDPPGRTVVLSEPQQGVHRPTDPHRRTVPTTPRGNGCTRCAGRQPAGLASVSAHEQPRPDIRGPRAPHHPPLQRVGRDAPKETVLLRKEVIQPHLPVRLPCYDFVPIASPTFDGSPPHGLGHRLRVLPTFVT